MNKFYDNLSEKLYREIPDTIAAANKVMLNIDHFEAGQSYVIAKVENRYGDTVKINIQGGTQGIELDRKSTRLNSSHANISYAVFCLKKKKKKRLTIITLIINRRKIIAIIS